MFARATSGHPLKVLNYGGTSSWDNDRNSIDANGCNMLWQLCQIQARQSPKSGLFGRRNGFEWITKCC